MQQHVTNPFAGLGNWYAISATSTFTVSGNVGGDTTFTIVTQGSSCTATELPYSIVVEPDPVTPDFVRMNYKENYYKFQEKKFEEEIINLNKITYEDVTFNKYHVDT